MAIGSSSTFGLGASLGKSYPAQLAEMLEKSLKGVNIEVVNRGISGEVAKTTAERLRLEIPGISPDLVLWQLGTNDALAGVPVVEFEATVRETIDWLKQRNIDVVLIGLRYTPNLAKNPYVFRSSRHVEAHSTRRRHTVRVSI
jgi:acyl-CoA thioesterase I